MTAINWQLYDFGGQPAKRLSIEERNELAESLLAHEPPKLEKEALWTTTGDSLVLIVNNDNETFDVYDCVVRRQTFVHKAMFREA